MQKKAGQISIRADLPCFNLKTPLNLRYQLVLNLKPYLAPDTD